MPIRPISLLLGLLILAACAAPREPQRFPEITFKHLPPIQLNVAKISYAQPYQAPASQPHVGHEFPTPPARAAERWIRDRLVASGTSGEATVTIREATATETKLAVKKGVQGAFTTDQAWRYDGIVDITVKAVDPNRQLSAAATASARQSQTIPEDATLHERETVWFDMVEKMMRRFDAAFEAQIRKDLAGFIK